MRRLIPLLALLLAPAAAEGAQETASDTLLTVNHYLDWEQVHNELVPAAPPGGDDGGGGRRHQVA